MENVNVLSNSHDIFWELIEDLAWCNTSDMLITQEYFREWFIRLLPYHQEIFRYEYAYHRDCIQQIIATTEIIKEYDIKDTTQLESIICHIIFIGHNIFLESQNNIDLIKFFIIHSEYQQIDIIDLIY